MLHRKKQPEIQGDHRPEYSAHTNSAPWYFYACFWPHIATGPHGRDGLRVCGSDRPRGCPPHPCGVAGQGLPPRRSCGAEDGERYEDFEAATGYGTGPGLCGWNCRHNFYPFYKEHWDYIRTKALTSGKSGAIVKQKIEADLREYVHNQLASDPLYVDKVVGENAANGSRKGSSLNELIADALLQKDKAR